MNVKKSRAIISIVAFTSLMNTVLPSTASAAVSSTFNSRIQLSYDYKSELKSYKNQLSNLIKAETEIVNGWSSVSGKNYTTDEAMYNKLVILLPKVNAFIGRIEAIQPNNSKIYNAHRLYVDGWNYQFQGFTMAMAALENQDYSQMTQANSYLAKGRAKITAFTRTLKTL